MLSGLATPTFAETVGLRVSPRGNVTVAGKEPASLHFTLSSYDSKSLDTSMPVSPLLLDLPQGTSSVRSNAIWADWFPFDSGLHTSAGLVWGDSRRNGNVFDAAVDTSMRSRAFLGLGWTSAASSSSTGSGWRLDADVGASLASSRDCVMPGGQCTALGTAGLKPNSGGDGIRWNPFISIGASFQY
ncbi:MAG: hypothetical protein JWM03_1391 [Rhodocyclales bacterium]|nr:hypothetical protein [Rhodocyclales bacterium]MDB5888519.1 hypothetical protein [Rhodocyclales bacterium]